MEQKVAVRLLVCSVSSKFAMEQLDVSSQPPPTAVRLWETLTFLSLNNPQYILLSRDMLKLGPVFAEIEYEELSSQFLSHLH